MECTFNTFQPVQIILQTTFFYSTFLFLYFLLKSVLTFFYSCDKRFTSMNQTLYVSPPESGQEFHPRLNLAHLTPGIRGKLLAKIGADNTEQYLTTF